MTALLVWGLGLSVLGGAGCVLADNGWVPSFRWLTGDL